LGRKKLFLKKKFFKFLKKKKSQNPLNHTKKFDPPPSSPRKISGYMFPGRVDGKISNRRKGSFALFKK